MPKFTQAAGQTVASDIRSTSIASIGQSMMPRVSRPISSTPAPDRNCRPFARNVY